MTALATWRATLRIARRSALRHKGRSALILAMITVPVFAGTVITVALHTMTATTAQQRAWSLGRADLQIYPSDSGKPPALLAKLPAGSRTVLSVDGDTDLRTAAGQVPVPTVAANLRDPIFTGMYLLHDGRYPIRADEIAVSPSLAHDRGLHLGGTVRLARPDRTERIVGLVQLAQSLDNQLIIAPSAAHLVSGSMARSYFISLPPGFHGLQTLLDSRADVAAVQSHDRAPPSASWVSRYGVALIVVGFAATEIVLLAGSAFAVGARRARRELGMIAAAGGGANHIALVVLGGGIVLGLAGGVIGVALGVAVACAGHSVLQQLSTHQIGATMIRPGELVGIAALAALSGVVAAGVPARWAGRQPVLDALTGRGVRPARSPHRIVLIGLGTAAVGGALAYLGATRPARPELIAIGSAVGLVGFALCAPSLVAASGRIAPFLPLPGRLALRDAARHRNRTGAAVAAVTAAVAGSVALSLYLASTADRSARESVEAPAGQVSIYGDTAALSRLDQHQLAAFGRAVHARGVAPIRLVNISSSVQSAQLSMPDQSGGEVAVGGAGVIRAVTGREPPAAALRLLHRGGIVTFVGTLRADGRMRLQRERDGATRQYDLPAMLVRAPHRYGSLPTAVLDSATASRLGIHSSLQRIVLDSRQPPSAAELESLNKLLADAWTPGVDEPTVSVATAPKQQERMTILLLAAASAFVTLAATGVAVGLSAAESREDVVLLAAIGAAPRVRRVMSGAQAGLISLLGTVLGIPAGVIPAAGVVSTHSDSMHFVVPWGPMALGCLAAPVVVVLLAGVCTRSRLPMPRRLN